jgi:GTP pyrophosphokinase
MSVEEILKLMDSPTEEDKELIRKAYNFAETAHQSQKRYSGEPYFVHAFETAKILAELGLGTISISAGLLHDILEDAGVKPETIEKEFGKEILFLVEGVTKLGKLRYHGAERHIESLRKLFVAMSQDLRVLIIKLSDRLHNMRTLQYVPKEKQKRIASETLEIYAPLAYRLGIRKLNRELEDLSFSYVYPKEYEETKNLLKQKKKEDLEHLEKFSKSIKKGLAKSEITNITTDYRVKNLYSLFQKLKRKDNDIEKIYDILALRVIVPEVEDCYKVLGAIHAIWRPLPGRIKDYIAFPKPNGYHGLHTTVFTGDGNIVEIQIRTQEMHHDAEYGIASHFAYKKNTLGKKSGYVGNMAWFKQFLPSFIFGEPIKDSPANATTVYGASCKGVPNWVKDLAQFEKSDNPDQIEFIDNLKTDFFSNRIFIFTPKGDVIDLPIDSSPIDFAYAIHSDIGNHMTGAKVNGKMASFDQKLQNGDIVEIITKESAHPNIKWLEFAKTTMAKKHIKGAVEGKK